MKTSYRRSLISVITGMLLLAGGMLVASGPAGVPDNRAVFEKREQLLQAFRTEGAGAVPQLIAALDDDSALVRRTAAHLLVRIGEPGREGFAKALANEDFQVRRIIIYGVAEMGILNDYWGTILLDTHPSIRRDLQLYFFEEYPIPQGDELNTIIADLASAYAEGDDAKRLHVVEIVATLDPDSRAARRLMLKAIADSHPVARETAFTVIRDQITPQWEEAQVIVTAAKEDELASIQAIGFEIERKVLGVEDITLPSRRWHFKTDPEGVGREQGWYAVNFDDSGWMNDARTETHWGRFLDEAYIGPAWYRRSIDVPAVEGWDKALLRFNGADEQAWVWLNGEYAGEHTMGSAGWDVPFMLDVTELVKTGQSNKLAVLVENTAGGGGLWQPIELIFFRNWD